MKLKFSPTVSKLLIAVVFWITGVLLGTAPLAYYVPKSNKAAAEADHWKLCYELESADRQILVLHANIEVSGKLSSGLTDIKNAKEKDDIIISSFSKPQSRHASKRGRAKEKMKMNDLYRESQALFGQGMNTLCSIKIEDKNGKKAAPLSVNGELSQVVQRK